MISLGFHAFPGKWNAQKHPKRWFSLLFATEISQNGTKIIQKPRAHLAKTFVSLCFWGGSPFLGSSTKPKTFVSLMFCLIFDDFRGPKQDPWEFLKNFLKNLWNSSKNLSTSSKNLNNSSKNLSKSSNYLSNSSKNPSNSSKNLSNSSQNLSNSSKNLSNSSKKLYNSSKNLSKSSKNLSNSSKNLSNSSKNFSNSS